MAPSADPASQIPINHRAPNVPYFTPLQNPPAGTAIKPDANTPLLFRPIKIRGAQLPHRMTVAPMCMYSADNGALTDFHVQHLGSMATRGAGLVMVEATAVLPEGRISAEDSGLWSESQVPALKRVVDYVHSQSCHLSLQLAHAGRKSSVVAPWLTRVRGQAITTDRSVGGWPERVAGPSAIQWDSHYAVPKELSKEGIKEIVDAFGRTAKLAVGAGIDSLEIHAAHGYLLNSFLSGAANKRTDEYGGSFENRTRILFETIASIRQNIPESIPLFVRVSGSDWLDKSKFPDAWDIHDTIRLAKMLYAVGVDLLDVSGGGNHPEQVIAMFSETQIKMAAEVRTALNEEGGEAAKLLVSAVGQIKDGKQAEAILQSGGADIITCGRAFLEDPGFVLHCAEELGVPIRWPVQYSRRHIKARY